MAGNGSRLLALIGTSDRIAPRYDITATCIGEDMSQSKEEWIEDQYERKEMDIARSSILNGGWVAVLLTGICPLFCTNMATHLAIVVTGSMTIGTVAYFIRMYKLRRKIESLASKKFDEGQS